MCMRRPVVTGIPFCTCACLWTLWTPCYVHAQACGYLRIVARLPGNLWLVEKFQPLSLPRLIITRPAHLCFASVDSFWSFTDVDRKVSQTSIERFQQGADSIWVFTAFPKAFQSGVQRVGWVQLMRTALRSRW